MSFWILYPPQQHSLPLRVFLPTSNFIYFLLSNVLTCRIFPLPCLSLWLRRGISSLIRRDVSPVGLLFLPHDDCFLGVSRLIPFSPTYTFFSSFCSVMTSPAPQCCFVSFLGSWKIGRYATSLSSLPPPWPSVVGVDCFKLLLMPILLLYLYYLFLVLFSPHPHLILIDSFHVYIFLLTGSWRRDFFWACSGSTTTPTAAAYYDDDDGSVRVRVFYVTCSGTS